MTDIFVAPKKGKNKTEEEPITPKEEKAEKQSSNSKKDSYKRFENSQVGLFSSFHLSPTNLTIGEQEQDEEVILFLKRHFITNLVWIFTSFVILILPIIFFVYREFFPIPLLPAKYNVVAFILYFIIVCLYAYINFISWFFDVSVVTQKRIIDVDYYNLFYQDTAVTRLNLIEEISFSQSGFIRSYFNYGDIFVQTAGQKSHFDLLAVPEPERALNIIENLMGGDRHVH